MTEFRYNTVVKWKYSEKCIKNIIKHISIIKVIEDLYLKPIPMKRKNKYYLKSTPFEITLRKSNRPFFISLDRKIFKCFITGYAGNVIGFVQKFLKMNKKQAITYLLIKYDQNNIYKEIDETRFEAIHDTRDLPF